MQRLLGSLLALTIAIIFTMNMTGCGGGEKAKKKEDKAEKKALALDKDEIEIKKEAKKTGTVKLKDGGKITDVSIDPKDAGVTVEKTDSEVTVKLDDDAKKVTKDAYTVTVKGKGTDDAEKTLTFKVKIKE